MIACAAVCILSGPTMDASALWVLGPLGRNRLALRIAGIALTASGVVLAAPPATVSCLIVGRLEGAEKRQS
jgi:hypothetical protein